MALKVENISVDSVTASGWTRLECTCPRCRGKHHIILRQQWTEHVPNSIQAPVVTTITALIHHHHPAPFHLSTRHVILFTAEMADQMDVDAVKGEQQEEKVGPAPDLPAERSTWFAFIHLHLPGSTE